MLEDTLSLIILISQWHQLACFKSQQQTRTGSFGIPPGSSFLGTYVLWSVSFAVVVFGLYIALPIQILRSILLVCK